MCNFRLLSKTVILFVMWINVLPIHKKRLNVYVDAGKCFNFSRENSDGNLTDGSIDAGFIFKITHLELFFGSILTKDSSPASSSLDST